MTTTKTTDTKTPEKWWESDWHKEWLQLSKKEYHGKRCGYWTCYYNEEGELIYEYVDM